MPKEEDEKFRTRIWYEVPEPDNEFAAAACYCHGYDVYGELIGKASWIEYLYLLFCGERPSTDQARGLEILAIALANPGIRESSVHAAMCGGAGGSTSASCLMAALAVGAGQLGGGREVFNAMEYWQQCGRNIGLWKSVLPNPPSRDRADVWPNIEHPPGFDPHGRTCPTPVIQTLALLAQSNLGETLPWLAANRIELEDEIGMPLAMAGVAAAALIDLGFDATQGEMIYLLLRLPGAAVHALEQQENGWRKFPLLANSIHLADDPKRDSSVAPEG